MNLFSYFSDNTSTTESTTRPVVHRRHVPRSPHFYAKQITFVDTLEGALSMADLARERDIAHIGLDTEYRFDRPGVDVGRGRIATDPHSIRPLLLSLALAEAPLRGQDEGALYPFVVDLRRPGLLPDLTTLLRLPIPFVGHNLKVECFCLFRFGLDEPTLLWDSWACSRALSLGRHHRKYLQAKADEAEEAQVRDQVEEDEEHRHSLLANCQRYGLHHPFASDKSRLQQSFLAHPESDPFSQEQIAYAAADAIAAAQLYPHQVLAATRGGILQHLTTVEMPWVITNARMIWHGVRVDADKCRQVRAAAQCHWRVLQPRLAEHGVGNVRSFPQLKRFFESRGLLELFWRNGKLSFDKEALDAFADRDPAIALIRAAKKVLQMQSDKLLAGAFVGSDGRVHPDYRQLGTDTGRQACNAPNILGLGKVFRPLIVPEAGRGLGEVDLSQIEVGLAGAVYHDDWLVHLFNTGDVYSAMAQHFYRGQLSEEDRSLPGCLFKKKYAEPRNRMKRCTLGILYGLTPYGLALYLGVSRQEANELLKRFMGMFPALEQALHDTPIFGGRRGYVPTVTGLRRYRAGRGGRVSTWERNWMTNHPVQGSAAVVFKAAGNRLDRLYRRYDAWLVVPLHDAYVFEAPLAALSEVAALTERVMCETVQEYFPQLRPQAESNISRPDCWNKEGHADSLGRWMADPTFRLA